MKRHRFKYLMMLLLTLFIFYGCGFVEGEYEIIGNQELQYAGIETPFPERHIGGRDEMTAHAILREEGYHIEQEYGIVREVQNADNQFKFSTRLQWIYLFDNYVIMTDGNRGIEDGFFRYFLLPIYTRLNTFDRETFELIDQRVIHGGVQNVIIVENNVYFNVYDYQNEGFYGRYRFK